MTSDKITPFHLDVPESELEQLRAKLDLTRWPDAEYGEAGQGVPLDRAKALVHYWRREYDWRRCEAMLNRFGQYRTTVEGVGIHFLHVRSPHAGALPLIMTHGWPGSVIEFHKVIGPLTEPEKLGGNAADAFHVVVPSLPGYGFSDKPVAPGWTIEKIASAWSVLMTRLGYEQYVAQGGDWGAAVTTALAMLKPAGLAGVHMNIVSARPKNLPREEATPEERRAIAAIERYQRRENGYAMIQATKPQTLVTGSQIRPQARRCGYTRNSVRGRTATGAGKRADAGRDAGRHHALLADEFSDVFGTLVLGEFFPAAGRADRLAAGFSIFPKELFLSPRHWAARIFTNIVYWNEAERGGHFAALEQPGNFRARIAELLPAISLNS